MKPFRSLLVTVACLLTLNAAQDVKTVNGLAIASVKTANGLAIASVKTINGVDNTASGGADVAFDTKFEKGASGQASPFSYTSNAGTVAGTVGSGTNRCLIAHVTWRGVTPSAVTLVWDAATTNQSFTQIGSTQTMAGVPMVQMLFKLVAPTSGAKTVTLAWTGGTANVVVGVWSFTNVDQTTPTQNESIADTATSTSASSTVTTTAGNAVVVGHTDDDASSVTSAAGTSDWIETALNGNHAGSHVLSTGTTAVVTWTLGSSVQWGNIKADVRKAP